MGKIVPFRPRSRSKSEPASESSDQATTTFEGPSRVHDRDWASFFSLEVGWLARRSVGALVQADGSITIWSAGRNDSVVRGVGQLLVVKACLATGEDLELAMNEVSDRHAKLAAGVFDRFRYSEEFETWCEETHGQHPLEDPLFLVELRLDRRTLADCASSCVNAPERPLDEWVAEVAAIDALAVLGAVGSPLIFLEPGSRSTSPRRTALGSAPWRPTVHVGFRPDP